MACSEPKTPQPETDQPAANPDVERATDAGPPSCEQIGDRIAAIAGSDFAGLDGAEALAARGSLAAMRREVIAACSAADWPDKILSCLYQATNRQDLDKCEMPRPR